MIYIHPSFLACEGFLYLALYLVAMHRQVFMTCEWRLEKGFLWTL